MSGQLELCLITSLKAEHIPLHLYVRHSMEDIGKQEYQQEQHSYQQLQKAPS